MENALVRVPSLGEMGVVKLINGPEAFTPDGEFILGPSDVRGFWVAAGFCAHGLAGAGGMGKLVAEWIVEGTPSLDVWHMDSRRFGAAYRSRRVHPRPHEGDLRDVLRRQVPGSRASGGPSAPRLARLRAAARARRRVRREVGLGASELVRAERSLGDESLRPRGWAGSSGLLRSAPSTRPAARPRRSSTSPRSRRSRSAARTPPLPRVALRQPRRPRRRRDHVHADAEPAGRRGVRLHGHAARRRSLPHRHRHRVRPARPLVDPAAPAGRRLGAGRRRHLGVCLLRALGTARREILQPLTTSTSRTRRSRTCGRTSSRSAPCRASRSA